MEMEFQVQTGRQLFPDDRSRWKAVVTRNHSAEGYFYFAVRTTGIYCRPGCAARTPARQNVVFFDSCVAAEHAGFRPCKRCRPRQSSTADLHRQIVARACRLIQESEQAPSLDTLARATGLSRFHFHRVFRRHTGLSPKAFASAHRAEKLRTALRQKRSVTEAIYDAGYNANSRFYERSTELLGMRPAQFRYGGKGVTITFAVGNCSLGFVLGATTEKGVCAILLGEDRQQLTRQLRRLFPHAELSPGDASFKKFFSRIVRLVERPQFSCDLPLDVRGTAFQERVWRELTKIRPGQTASYSEIARRIGQPRAVRAVAGACAANRLAVAIPCHRAQRADGALAGYRWGLARKQKLLQKERSKSAR